MLLVKIHSITEPNILTVLLEYVDLFNLRQYKPIFERYLSKSLVSVATLHGTLLDIIMSGSKFKPTIKMFI